MQGLIHIPKLYTLDLQTLEPCDKTLNPKARNAFNIQAHALKIQTPKRSIPNPKALEIRITPEP